MQHIQFNKYIFDNTTQLVIILEGQLYSGIISKSETIYHII